jgi:hypothetical protein
LEKCENLKNRIELKLTTSNEKATKSLSKLHFKNNKCIDGLHLIHMFKQELIYDRPSYIGCSILGLSKVHMMKFVYEVIHSNLEGRYTLLYSDTDSLVIDIKHHDVYEWIWRTSSTLIWQNQIELLRRTLPMTRNWEP